MCDGWSHTSLEDLGSHGEVSPGKCRRSKPLGSQRMQEKEMLKALGRRFSIQPAFIFRFRTRGHEVLEVHCILMQFLRAQHAVVSYLAGTELLCTIPQKPALPSETTPLTRLDHIRALMCHLLFVGCGGCYRCLMWKRRSVVSSLRILGCCPCIYLDIACFFNVYDGVILIFPSREKWKKMRTWHVSSLGVTS